MKRLILAFACSLALAFPGVAHADSGTYTLDDGTTCNWMGSYGYYYLDCSGYSRAAGGYLSYHCDVQVIGTYRSWSCRDTHGNSWRGSS